MKWTKSDIETLKENYSTNGPEYCSTLLKRTKQSVSAKAFKIGLKVPISLKSKIQSEASNKHTTNKYKVKSHLFISNFTKESIYIMGLLFADGCIFSNETIGNKKNKILLNIVAEDGDSLFNTFCATGEWARHYKAAKDRKKQMRISTSNRPLVHFLLDHGYCPNSKTSPNKLISLFPEHLKHYWFRGFVDGDGCFGFYPQKRVKMFSITGPYDQDWSFITDLFKSLLINTYSIRKEITKCGHKYSQMRISNKDGIIKIGKFIYQNFPSDTIGLTRKYDKWMNIINHSQ